MARINKYDPPKMRSTAEKLSRALKDFQTAKNNVDTIITYMNLNWNDSVNSKFSSSYLNVAKPKAADLEKLMQKYISALYQCSTRFGSVIDSGNSYLTGF